MTEIYFKELFEKNHKSLVWYASRRIGEFYAADIVSDTFAMVWENGIPEGYIGNEKGYLYLSVNSRCLNINSETTRTRKERRGRKECKLTYQATNLMRPDVVRHLTQNTISEEYADSLSIKADLVAILSKTYEQLNNTEKEIFTHSILYEKSNTEVAEVTGHRRDYVAFLRRGIIKELKDFGLSLMSRQAWKYDSNNGWRLMEKYKKQPA